MESQKVVHPRSIASGLSVEMITEILQNKIVTDQTILVIKSVMSALGELESWERGKKVMSKKEEFLNRLKNYDCEKMNQLKFIQLQKYIEKPNYPHQQKDNSNETTQAVYYLSQWVIALVMYHMKLQIDLKNKLNDLTYRNSPRKVIAKPSELKNNTPQAKQFVEKKQEKVPESPQQESQKSPRSPILKNSSNMDKFIQEEVDSQIDDQFSDFKKQIMEEIQRHKQSCQMLIEQQFEDNEKEKESKEKQSNLKLTGYATGVEGLQGKKEVYQNGLITYASPVHHRYDKDTLKKYKNKEVGAARSWIK